MTEETSQAEEYSGFWTWKRLVIGYGAIIFAFSAVVWAVLTVIVFDLPPSQYRTMHYGASVVNWIISLFFGLLFARIHELVLRGAEPTDAYGGVRDR